jgi:deazaflavin-dependent oxidoreductase (nitroreductase family)
MTPKRNAIQRLIQRIAMLHPVTTFFAGRLHRMDGMALKLTKGKYALSEIAGWPVIQLSTIGAKSGKTYTLPLIGLLGEEKIALVASSFGREHNPGWYYNLKACPQCTVQFKGTTAEYTAREAHGEEYEKYWRMAVSYYKGYELYAQRAAHRRIPIMILRPGK